MGACVPSIIMTDVIHSISAIMPTFTTPSTASCASSNSRMPNTEPTMATLNDTRLTPEQIANYRRDGFLIVRDVFTTEETAELDVEAHRLLQLTDLIDSDNIRCRWQNSVTTGECRFDCFDPVIDISPVCASVARDPRMIELVSTLYGERAHLFKDKLIFKPPGAKGYALHQ